MSKDDFLLDVAASNGKPQRLVCLVHTTDGNYRDNINTDSARSRETFINGAAQRFRVDVDSLGWLRDELPRVADEADAKLDEQLGDDDRGDRDKKSTADLLVDLALKRYRFGRTDSDDVFAVELNGPNVALMFRGSREALRAKLSREFREVHGRTPNSNAMGDTITALQGEAYAAEPEPVYLRVAEHDGKIVVDLGDSTGQAVVVGAHHWEVVDRSPVLFRRTAATGILPVPQQGGSLSELRRLLNVSADTWPLVKGWLVASLVPNIPHPILLMGGQQGTGKTTAAAEIIGVVDPSPAILRSQPRDVRQWAISATASWIVGVDNVSTISDWWSDSLCKAVTGDGWLDRKLYTDGELSVLSFQRVILLTSIDAGALRGDLGDRVLLVDLEPIDETSRRTKGELDHQYDEAKPRIFGALLDLLSRVLAELPNVNLDRLPRMADFGRLLGAMDLATDNPTESSALCQYIGQRARIAESVIEADQVALAIQNLAETEGSWQGTAQELLDKITPEKPPRGWPRTPQAIGGRIKRITPALEQAGIVVIRDREGHNRSRMYHLEKQCKHSSATSAPCKNSDKNSPDPADNA
ncbi:MAG: hypothetical protein IH831_10645, partial [Planctomycetes bacterium]|nr:hypothetical protein [Planctomycetota bacterium]